MKFRVLIALIGIAACRPRADARDVRDFERMRRQQRYDTYERSRFFANGAVLQAPPEHTVAHDSVDNAVDGARQFAISCAPCHGAGGFGGGPLAINLSEKRPPSLRSAMVQGHTPEHLFAVVTDGFGRMPPYGWQMTPAQRQTVIAYVRTLTAQPMNAETRSDSAVADSIRRIDSLRAAGASLRQRMSARFP